MSPIRFIAKLGSDGGHVWSDDVQGDGSQAVRSIAVDPSDNVIVAGGFWGDIDFGGGVMTAPAAANDVFVAKSSP